jgi:hypothetical protein
MRGDDLSLRGEVSCKERGGFKLPLLENYELSLMQKMKLSARHFALHVMILVVSKSIFDTWLTAQVQIVLTGAVEPFRDTSGYLWIRVEYLSCKKIFFLTP